MRKIIFTSFALFAITVGTNAQDAESWVRSRVWAPEGFSLCLHESVDTQQFYAQYHKNQEVWDTVFAFLRDTKLDTLSVGERPLMGTRCILRITEGNTKEIQEPMRFEHHKKYIDLQINRTGSELIGMIAPADTRLHTPYNPTRDVELYTTDQPEKVKYYRSTPDLFFLCFPDTYHMPSLKDGKIQSVKKLVIKIEYVP